jgi:hypothetical protein
LHFLQLPKPNTHHELRKTNWTVPRGSGIFFKNIQNLTQKCNLRIVCCLTNQYSPNTGLNQCWVGIPGSIGYQLGITHWKPLDISLSDICIESWYSVLSWEKTEVRPLPLKKLYKLRTKRRVFFFSGSGSQLDSLSSRCKV